MKNHALKRSKILLLALVMIFSTVLAVGLSTQAQAADSPLAELYFYNHGAVSGLSALNTATYKSSTESEIDHAGYRCYSYTNVQAGPKKNSSVMRTLGDDTVFFISGHAGKGRVVCVDNSNNVTRISAKKRNGVSTNYSLEWNYESTPDQLKSMRLAFWWGCHTYGYDSAYGSLNTKSNTLGIDCNITQDEHSWTTPGNYFTYRFAKYLDDGQTVSSSLAYARYDTIQSQGNSDDHVLKTVSNYKIRGVGSSPGSLKIEPASYGTY